MSDLALGLDLQASSATVRGVALYGFGNATNSNDNANIRIGATAANVLIEGNILGTSASSFTDLGDDARSGGDLIRSVGATAASSKTTLSASAKVRGSV